MMSYDRLYSLPVSSFSPLADSPRTPCFTPWLLTPYTSCVCRSCRKLLAYCLQYHSRSATWNNHPYTLGQSLPGGSGGSGGSGGGGGTRSRRGKRRLQRKASDTDSLPSGGSSSRSSVAGQRGDRSRVGWSGGHHINPRVGSRRSSVNVVRREENWYRLLFSRAHLFWCVLTVSDCVWLCLAVLSVLS